MAMPLDFVPSWPAVVKSTVCLLPTVMLTSVGAVSGLAQSLPESTIQTPDASPALVGASIIDPFFFTLPPPPDTDTPSGRASGGGVRQGCGVAEGLPPLTALVPVDSPKPSKAVDNDNGNDNAPVVELDLVWSYTTQSDPTLWFYVPHQLSGQTEVLFVLNDKEGEILETQSFYPNTTPGIVSATLANRELTVGEHYQWYFLVYCAESPDFVSGWIYATEGLPYVDDLSPREQARTYSNAGIWQDTLTLLAQQQQTQLDDLSVVDDWRSLLRSVGLEELADQPFVDCCFMEDDDIAHHESQ